MHVDGLSFYWRKVSSGQLDTRFVGSKDQLADIHTKALAKQMFAIFETS